MVTVVGSAMCDDYFPSHLLAVRSPWQIRSRPAFRFLGHADCPRRCNKVEPRAGPLALDRHKVRRWLFHVALILSVPWTTRWVPATVSAGIFSVDFFIILVILDTLETFVKRREKPETNSLPRT